MLGAKEIIRGSLLQACINQELRQEGCTFVAGQCRCRQIAS